MERWHSSTIHPLEGAVCVADRLLLHGGDVLAAFGTLRLGNTHGSPIDKQGIVHLARAGGELPHGDAQGGGWVQFV